MCVSEGGRRIGSTKEENLGTSDGAVDSPSFGYAHVCDP